MTKDDFVFLSKLMGCEEGFSADQLQTAVTAHEDRMNDLRWALRMDLVSEICRFVKHNLGQIGMAESIYEKFKGDGK